MSYYGTCPMYGCDTELRDGETLCDEHFVRVQKDRRFAPPAPIPPDTRVCIDNASDPNQLADECARRGEWLDAALLYMQVDRRDDAENCIRQFQIEHPGRETDAVLNDLLRRLRARSE